MLCGSIAAAEIEGAELAAGKAAPAGADYDNNAQQTLADIDYDDGEFIFMAILC